MAVGKLITAAQSGIKGDGITDNTKLVHAIIDGLKDGNASTPAVIQLPPGRVVLDSAMIDRPRVRIQGAGKHLTTVVPPNNVSSPPLIFGFRRAEMSGSVTVGSQQRPDGFGILDATLAPQAGAWRGLSSAGNTYATCIGNPAQLGVPKGGGWDGYSSLDGLTVEIALFFPTGWKKLVGTILGLGNGYNPAPWWFGGNGEGGAVFEFKLAGMSSDPNTPIASLSFDGRTTPGLHRYRFTLDNKAGRAEAWMDKSLVASRDYSPGTKLLRPRGHLPFWIGPSPDPSTVHFDRIDLPLFSVMAFRVSGSVIPDGGTDSARYGPHPDTIASLNGADPSPPSRKLPMLVANDGRGRVYSSALIIRSSGWDGGIDGNSVSDLTVESGSIGLALGAVLDFSARDMNCVAGNVGVGSIPAGSAYTVNLSGMLLEGADTGISLSRQIVYINQVSVNRGGSTYARFPSCVVSWSDAFFGFYAEDNFQTGIDFPEDGDAALANFSGFYFDQEGAAPVRGFFTVDTHANTSIVATNILGMGVNPGGAAIVLRGKQHVRGPAGIFVQGLIAPTGTPPVLVEGDPDVPAWSGSIQCAYQRGEAVGNVSAIAISGPKAAAPAGQQAGREQGGVA